MIRDPQEPMPPRAGPVEGPEALKAPEKLDVHAVWWILYLGTAMVLAITLAYVLSDGLVTRFPTQNLFFFIFWAALAPGPVLLARAHGKPLRGSMKTALFILVMAFVFLFFGHLIFV